MRVSDSESRVWAQAHWGRLGLPVADYVTDTKSVLDQAVRVLQARVCVCVCVCVEGRGRRSAATATHPLPLTHHLPLHSCTRARAHQASKQASR